mmetsp:Transcript_122427/g.391731  ORF Transcript_122427/g.391731 Transcript_122427/m.391731 type:complete len:248 (-) Transcript_122427:27-770(-)
MRKRSSLLHPAFSSFSKFPKRNSSSRNFLSCSSIWACRAARCAITSACARLMLSFASCSFILVACSTDLATSSKSIDRPTTTSPAPYLPLPAGKAVDDDEAPSEGASAEEPEATTAISSGVKSADAQSPKQPMAPFSSSSRAAVVEAVAVSWPASVALHRAAAATAGLRRCFFTCAAAVPIAPTTSCGSVSCFWGESFGGGGGFGGSTSAWGSYQANVDALGLAPGGTMLTTSGAHARARCLCRPAT